MTSPKARNKNGDYVVDGHVYPGVSRVSKTKRSFGLDWWLSGVTTAELARRTAEGDTEWAEAIMAGDARAFDTASERTILRRGELINLEPHKAAAHVYKWASEQAPRDAADLGTAIHAAIEEVEAGLATLEEISDEEVRASVETYLAAKAEHRWRVVESEVTVVSEAYGYAGTADLIIDLPGVGLVLADIKTGSDVYPDVALQLAAYSHADFIWEVEE